MRRGKPARPAYTLFEIVCVLALVVIIAALTIPAMQAMLTDSRVTAAGDLETRDIGRAGRRRIKALALHHIRPIDPRGRDLDQHFAFARARQRTPLGHEHIRSAGRADRDRSHLGEQCGHGKSPWLARVAALA